MPTLVQVRALTDAEREQIKRLSQARTAPAPANIPDPVVATDASVTGWSDPQPTDSRFGTGTTHLPTVVQYRYCIWTYSDNSTLQQVFSTKYSTVSGNLSAETEFRLRLRRCQRAVRNKWHSVKNPHIVLAAVPSCSYHPSFLSSYDWIDRRYAD